MKLNLLGKKLFSDMSHKDLVTEIQTEKQTALQAEQEGESDNLTKLSNIYAELEKEVSNFQNKSL